VLEARGKKERIEDRRRERRKRNENRKRKLQ